MNTDYKWSSDSCFFPLIETKLNGQFVQKVLMHRQVTHLPPKMNVGRRTKT